MAAHSSYEEKEFLIPGSPLKARLTLDREHSFVPALRVAVYGEKGEHKDPRYWGAAVHLLKALRFDAANSRLLNTGDMQIDYYSGYDLSLHLRYPNWPALRYPLTLGDALIRVPFGYARILWDGGGNGERLFALLAKKIPQRIPELEAILARDQDPRAQAKPPSTDDDMKQRKEACVILGVAEHAPWSDVKKRYRLLAKKLHPDLNGGADDGSFRRLQNAYDVLEELAQRR